MICFLPGNPRWRRMCKEIGAIIVLVVVWCTGMDCSKSRMRVGSSVEESTNIVWVLLKQNVNLSICTMKIYQGFESQSKISDCK